MRKSQIGAWASKQSQKLKSKSNLKTKFDDFEAKYEGKEIPRPEYWYGYCVYPDCFEFWLQGEGRLHDRVEYKLKNRKMDIKTFIPLIYGLLVSGFYNEQTIIIKRQLR